MTDSLLPTELQSGDSTLSIGVDICDVERFSSFTNQSAFTQRVFTQAELEQCQQKHSLAESLAVRFAGKEAVQKSLQELISYDQIEILTDTQGKPSVTLLDPTLQSKYNVIISLSHTKTLAQAFCITQKNK